MPRRRSRAQSRYVALNSALRRAPCPALADGQEGVVEEGKWGGGGPMVPARRPRRIPQIGHSAAVGGHRSRPPPLAPCRWRPHAAGLQCTATASASIDGERLTRAAWPKAAPQVFHAEQAEPVPGQAGGPSMHGTQLGAGQAEEPPAQQRAVEGGEVSSRGDGLRPPPTRTTTRCRRCRPASRQRRRGRAGGGPRYRGSCRLVSRVPNDDDPLAQRRRGAGLPVTASIVSPSST